MQYKLKIDYLKCIFSVSFGKFSRFTQHHKKTNLGSAKVKAFQAMEAPTTCKKLKSFMGRVPYIHKFVLAFPKHLKPFLK